MKKHRIWVQYIVDGDIAGSMEVGTDDDINGHMLWNEVKRILSPKIYELVFFTEKEEVIE